MSPMGYSLPMTLTATVDEEDDVLGDIMAEMMSWEEDGKKVLAPAAVYSDCPYASFVEFGTLPGMEKPRSDSEMGARMELWVEKRLNEQDGVKRRKVAMRMKKHIDTKGIAPSPYMRSSIELVLAEVCPGGDASRYIEEGGSIRGIAEAIRDRVKTTMEYNGMDIYGVLKDSFHVEDLPYTLAGKEVVVDEAFGDSSVSEDMWQDKTLGRGGKRPTRYWKGAR